MAKVKPTRNLTDPSYVPNPDDLDVGELALNAVTGELFAKLSNEEVRRVTATTEVVRAEQLPDETAERLAEAVKVPVEHSGTCVYVASEHYRASGEPRDLGALTVLGKAYEEDGTPIGASLQVRSHWPGVDTELELRNREGDFCRITLPNASLNASATLISPKPIELNGHIKVPGTGGSESLHIYSNVALSDRLQVSGDSIVSGDLQAHNVTAVSNSSLGFAEASDLTVSGAVAIDGPVRVSSGSYSAPSIHPPVDEDTGISFPSADTMALSTSGEHRIWVRSDGGIGIGSTGQTGSAIKVAHSSAGASGIGYQSSATVSGTNYYSRFDSCQITGSASGYIATYCQAPAVSGGASLATYRGLVVTNPTGAEAAQAVFCGVNTESGKSKHNIYADGTAPSFFRGNVGVNDTSPTAALTVNADTIRLRSPRTPASATDSGNRGDICWDSSYVYVCISDNVWRRASLSSW